MPYNDDENHYRVNFTILNKQMTQINTAERLAAKEFFGLLYKVTTNCNPTKPYIQNRRQFFTYSADRANEVNKSLIYIYIYLNIYLYIYSYFKKGCPSKT